MFKLDSDKYPTEETLENIKNWSGSWQELMGEISPLFEPYGKCLYDPETEIWEIATQGWSGCEDIIGALSANHMFWMFCWVSSRRGGYFKFETKSFNEE